MKKQGYASIIEVPFLNLWKWTPTKRLAKATEIGCSKTTNLICKAK